MRVHHRGHAVEQELNCQGILADEEGLHLFDVEVPGGTKYLESANITAGKEVVTFTIGYVTFGLSTCYDLRFPELYRALAARGAPMSRDQYAALRRTWTPRGTVYLRALSVNVLSANTAGATALFRLVNGDQNILGRRAFRLARRSGQWLVVDARFVGPIPWDQK